MRVDLKFWRSQTPFRAHFSGVCGAPAGVSGAVMRVWGAPAGVSGAVMRVCGAKSKVCGAVKLHLGRYIWGAKAPYSLPDAYLRSNACSECAEILPADPQGG